jgi:hypothetical protein
MDTKKVIGHIDCPICKYEQQEVREDRNGKPYIVCDECGMQLFTRQAKAMNLLRAGMKAIHNPPANSGMPAAPVQQKTAPVIPVNQKPEALPEKKKRSLLEELWSGTEGVAV